MKFLRSRNEKFVFSLNRVEHRILQDILQLYPLVPGSHQKLSKSLHNQQLAEAQQLLDEALAEQRASHKGQIEKWLKAKGRFRRTKTSVSLYIPHQDTDWLLQILNDIRIGSWLLLGSPGDRPDPDEIDPELHPVWAAMEVTGIFQMALLHALERQSAG